MFNYNRILLNLALSHTQRNIINIMYMQIKLLEMLSYTIFLHNIQNVALKLHIKCFLSLGLN